MKRAVLGALAVMLVGCATQYGDMGFAGGVRADQMSANTYRIVSRGNGYTDSTATADFAMRKAAETTIASGNTWFIVMGREDQTGVSTSVSTTPTTTYGTATAYGNTATYTGTTYGGSTSIETVVKPGEDMMIRVGSGQRPETAYDAAETLTYVVPRTERRTNGAGSVAKRALLGG